jgi:hypothetical protein
MDNLSGDYYTYEDKTNDWKPSGNVGLHYSRAMSDGSVAGDLVKKVSTYQPKVTDMKA